MYNQAIKVLSVSLVLSCLVSKWNWGTFGLFSLSSLLYRVSLNCFKRLSVYYLYYEMEGSGIILPDLYCKIMIHEWSCTTNNVKAILNFMYAWRRNHSHQFMQEDTTYGINQNLSSRVNAWPAINLKQKIFCQLSSFIINYLYIVVWICDSYFVFLTANTSVCGFF